jgi:hypothetical protein
MSFDVFLVSHNYTGETSEGVNPWNGERTTFRVDAGLNGPQSARVKELLAANGVGSCDDHGCYRVELADGGHCELFASKLDSAEAFDSCMFAIRSEITPQLSALIFDIAHVGEMSIWAATGSNCPIVTHAELVEKLLADDQNEAIVCRSSNELRGLLGGGFDAWNGYRARVLGAGSRAMQGPPPHRPSWLNSLRQALRALFRLR